MKTILPFLFWATLLSVSCSEPPPLWGTITLDSEDDWAPTVYLIQPASFADIASSYRGVVLDSATIGPDGTFGFSILPDAPEPILLQLAIQKKGERFFNKLENEEVARANYFPIIWENGSSLKVSAEADQFQQSFTISDPLPANAALLRLRDIRQKGYQQYLAGKDADAHDEDKLLEHEEALLNFRQPLMDFAAESTDLLPALVAIRWVSIEGDYERVPEFIFSQCQHWQAKYASHPWVAQLCAKAKREELPVMKGDVIPDFPLPMLAGDTLALHQQLGQRLTILDLWASWCGPCRVENRDVLAPLWDQHHQEGLQIIGYALDASERAWKRAIETDGADLWTHASHLQGDDSPLFNRLRIKTIPANFLLDENGEVLAKNLHGDELVEFVEAYLK